MPTYSQGPRLLKGAIVAIDPATSGRSTIVFQYNPETLKRSLEPQLAGAPVETIDLEVSVDTVDQLEAGQGGASRTSDESPRAGRLDPGRRAGR